MGWFWAVINSLLPVSDWRRVLERHGLAVALVGGVLMMLGYSLHFVGYELLIPLRDELVATSKELRANNGELTEAKLQDSLTLSKLTQLFEDHERGRNAEKLDDLTRNTTRER